MKESRLILVDITEIVWGFTGEADAKTVPPELAQHKSSSERGPQLGRKTNPSISRR